MFTSARIIVKWNSSATNEVLNKSKNMYELNKIDIYGKGDLELYLSVVCVTMLSVAQMCISNWARLFPKSRICGFAYLIAFVAQLRQAQTRCCTV